MQTRAINPYAFVGAKHKETLDFIGSNLPPDPTFEQFNEVLVAGSFNADPDHPLISGMAGTFAGTILPNAYNGYVNRLTKSNTTYTEAQQQWINEVIQGINKLPPGEIGTLLETAEVAIAQRGFTYDEQVPLFIALACAKADYEYWENQMTSPGIWTAYMDVNPAIGFMYLPGVVTAALQGALLTYGLMRKPELQILDVYISLIGSTGLAAGKVVFGIVGE